MVDDMISHPPSRSRSRPSERGPLFVFLDLDGTIIGPVDNQISEWGIVNNLNESIQNSGLSHRKIPHNTKCLRNNLKKNIVRPGLKKFINGFSKTHDRVEFFIYTASSSEWAAFIVKNIEEAIGVRFNRPLFTRNHCIEESPHMYIKSLRKVMPKAKKAVSSSYTQGELEHARCILIDNNRTLVHNESDLLYLCPTYYGMSPYSDLLWIETFITNRHVERLFIRILSVFVGSKDCRYDVRSKLYKNMLELSDKSMRVSNSNDNMWGNMRKVLMIHNNINEIGRIL